jgi:hypothetical protein
MFRHFKRHYHLVKKAYLEMAESGNLSINLHWEDGELSVSTEMPERERTTRFLAVMRNFLDDRDKLHYKKIWKILKSDFSDEIQSDKIRFIDEAVVRLENGAVQIAVNDKVYSPKEIFRLLSSAGFFESNEKSRELIASIYKIPAAEHIFWNQFLDYAINAFRIVSAIFSLILEVEKTEKFRSRIESEEPQFKKCIYCFSETGTFNSEEHIIAETLGGDEFYLPKGFVCDECNNGVSSRLDESLLKFEPIAFLSVIHTPYTKKGKLPTANFQNMTVEKKSPNYIEFKAKDKTGRIKKKEKLKDGRDKLTLSFTGKRLDWKRLARTIYKIALGMVAYDYGHEAALSDKYQAARDFILAENGSFNNNMLVTMKSKPHNQIRIYSDTRCGGTPYFIDIFGFTFMINLEETPVLRKDESVDEVLKPLAGIIEFEQISLN